jgi:hypothetical protein
MGMNNEQGTENNEQRTGNREQGFKRKRVVYAVWARRG